MRPRGNRGRVPPAFVGCALALALAACAAAPVRYYTLASTAPPQAVRQVADVSGRKMPIHFDLASVGVPERLARPQMVVRSAADRGSTRVDVLEQQRWSSPFDSELRDALASAIASRLGAVDVTRGGQLPGHPVYRIAVRLRQFDAILDQRVNADFGWTITRSDDERNAICRSFDSEPVSAGMDGLVQGVQRAVANTADRIAAQIARLQDNRSAPCDSREAPGSAS